MTTPRQNSNDRDDAQRRGRESSQQRMLPGSGIAYRTRGNTGIQGKQRVFVSFDDRDGYLLQSICDDILSLVDCAILFSEGAADVGIENAAETAGRIDLFVLCVTVRYLYSSERSLEKEIEYAQAHGIPVLPLLMEKDIDAEYQERFPRIQYLKKYSDDLTEIPYAKKLSDYLSSVLINDELFEKIRDAFDAFIFLSYRKKDRKYAQELMHLIHSNPFCRKVAVWYDEYLVPGENFTDALKKMIEDSHLFAMVVTPNILEEGNYVMREEYPCALEAGKSILPVSMVETDEKRLQTCFAGLSRPVDGRKEELSERLKNMLSEYAGKPRDGEPRHTFFIGLAYLLGIFMEEDNKMGLSMIIRAAEEKLPEAARKLGQLYRYGQGVKADLGAAIDWQKKYRDLLKEQYTDVLDDSVHVLIEAENDLAEMELESNRIKDARNTCWRGIDLCRGCEWGSYYSASRIPYFAKLYLLLGDVFLKRSDEKQAIECYSKDLSIYLDLSDANPDQWEILMNTCRCFFKLYDLGQRYSDWYYDRILGYLNHVLSIHYDAGIYLMLAKCLKMFGDYYGWSKAKDCYEQTVAICTEVAEKHKTVDTLSVLADAYLLLSRWHLFREQRKEAGDYVRKADSVCRESIRLCKSATGYLDLLKCYERKVEILRRSDGKEDPEHPSPGPSEKLFHLYDETLQVISVLEKEYPGPAIDFFRFRACAVFYEFCTTEMVMEAYWKALALARSHPVLYYSDYTRFKRTLWKHEKLAPEAYRNFIPFDVSRGMEQNRFFEVFNPSEKLRILVDTMDEPPSGTVRGIKVSEDVLLGFRSEAARGYSGLHGIQICRPDGRFKQHVRTDPTPDEFVYLSTETDSHAIEDVKYIRCSG